MHSEGSGKVIRISVNVSKGKRGHFLKQSGKNVRVKNVRLKCGEKAEVVSWRRRVRRESKEDDDA